jgi:adenylate cyclase
MALHIEVSNPAQRTAFEHPSGPLEFGRGPQRELPRCVIAGDQSVSRDQLRVEPLADGRIRLENLSANTPVVVEGQSDPIIHLQARDLAVPVAVTAGRTRIEFRPVAVSGSPPQQPRTASPVSPSAPTPQAPPAPATVTLPPGAADPPPGLRSLPTPERAAVAAAPARARPAVPSLDAASGVGPWLERIIEIQKISSESREFHDTAARALIDLVGFDLGLVLLRAGEKWTIAGCGVESDRTTVRYSQTLLKAVVDQRKTFFDDLESLTGSGAGASLMDIEAGVASPIFGLTDDVIGVLYGVRTTQGLVARGPITPLEAQLVQLLAGSVGATLARSTASQSQATFEQFFTRELSEQLALRPNLLDGHDADVSILFCDIRGFSRISERLGPAGTMEWIGDVMGELSDCVLAHSGVLVDYIGDELIAMWGAPVDQPDHATLSARAAVDMLAAVPRINERWAATLGEPMDLGIGINSGVARVGNTGSRHKFKYGPLGNTVNLASRVQGATKYVRSRILVTDATRSKMGAGFASRRVCQVRVVNIAEPVVLHELGRTDDAGWGELQRAYEGALSAFEHRNFHEAAHLLGDLLQTRPDDGPSLLLLSRVANCLVSTDRDFNPCWDLPGK